MAWKTVFFGTALGLSTAVPAQSVTVLQSESGPIDTRTQTEDLEFKDDAHQRMTVPVHVSGAGPFRFMVDTGADRTAISRELAERLNLAEGNAATLHSVAGSSRVETALVRELRFSRRSVKSIEAPLLESANIGADGILGVDSLRSQRIQFDFERNIMSIVPSHAAEHIRDPEAIVITARRRNGRLIFTDAKIDGQRVTVILDTGSEVTLGNGALREALERRKRQVASEKVQLHSVTGATIDCDYALIGEIDIGGVALKGMSIAFADAHTFRKLNLAGRPALLLGMDAIRAFKRVSIDFANRTFRVVVPQSSSLDLRLAGFSPHSANPPSRGY
jgi:predicted aspartyl protease